MPTIGEFIFDLAFGKADTKNLDDAEAKSRKTSRQVAEQWTSAGKSIGKALAAVSFGALGAAAGVFKLVESTASAGDEVAKTSKGLGIAARELQRLRFAAERSGGTAEGMTRALRTMTVGLQDAVTKGTGPVAEGLDAIGLSAAALQGQGVEDQFGIIAEALGRVDDQATRSAIAMKIFGSRGGAALKPLLDSGAQGIRALGDEAERLGIVLDDKTLAQSEQFADDLLDLKGVVTGLARDVAGELIPAVSSYLAEAREWILANKDLVKTRVREFLSALIPLLKSMASLTSSVVVGVGKLTEVLGPEGLVAAVGGAQVALAALRGGFIGLLPHIAAVTAAVLAGTAAINGFADAKIKALQTKVEAGNQELETRKARDRKRLQGETDAQLRQRVRELEGSGAQKFVQDILDERQQIQGTLTGTLDSVNAQADAQIADQQAVQAGLASSLGIVNGRRRGRGGGGGGGRQRPQEFKTDAMSRKADELFGEEIRMLAEKGGVGEIAIKAALGSATESLQTGAAERVARQAALKRLGGLTGQDLGGTEVDNSPLSQIFNGENVPDVELSSLARGAKPQTLVSTINNTFNFDNAFEISGAGDPGEVARNAITNMRDMFQEGLERSTRTAKVVYAR